jgi:hypothetical protein
MEKARKELKKREAALAKLNDEKNTLTQSLAKLTEERSIALRSLAAGDEKQRKTIIGIEADMVPLSHSMEGLDALIQEASDAIRQVEADLQEARSLHDAELKEYLKRREAEERAKLLDGVPERKRRLIEAYTDFCQLLGELQIDSLDLRTGKPELVQEITDFTMSLIQSLTSGVRSKGLRPLMQPGYAGNIPIWSLFSPDPEVTARFGAGIGPLTALAVKEIRRAKLLKELTEEFEQGRR